jgi:hypothetical protein
MPVSGLVRRSLLVTALLTALAVWGSNAAPAGASSGPLVPAPASLVGHAVPR